MSGKYKTNHKEKKREEKRRYRERTGAGLYGWQKWQPEEDNMIMNSTCTDRKLGEMLHRSVGSIQKRRWLLRKGCD